MDRDSELDIEASNQTSRQYLLAPNFFKLEHTWRGTLYSSGACDIL